MPDRQFSLLQVFSFICFVALAVFAVVLNLVLANSLEHNMLLRSQKIIARIVQQEIPKEFSLQQLREPKFGQDHEKFSEKIRHLSFPDVERIKIYSRNKVVIWADSPRLIGQRHPDNHELDEALVGEVVADMSHLEKEEQYLEREEGHKRLLELYVPIRFGGPAAPVETVFEIYQNLEPLYVDLAVQKQRLWFLVAGGGLSIYLVLVWLVAQASNRLERQHRALQKSERSYRHLIENAQDGIVAIDRQGIVRLFNPAAESFFGFAAHQIVGQPVTRLMAPGFRPTHDEAFLSLFEQGPSSRFGELVERQGMRGDGSTFPLEMSFSLAEGGLIVAIMRDVTVKKRLQKELVEAEKQASIAVIAGSIGHEINNAISGIAGYGSLLQRRQQDPEFIAKCSEVMLVQSERLRAHANNLLTLGQPRNPRMESVSVNQMIEKVVDLLETSGLLKQFTIERDYTSGLAEVLADEALLEQVVRNLVINAAHAMGEQGVLTIGTFATDSCIAFSVRDTGVGIPADLQENIFEPFFTTKEKGKGTGLGMYIVRQIIEQHNGELRLESKVGEGTCVQILLPEA